MMGQARDEGVSIKRSSTSKEFRRKSSVGSVELHKCVSATLLEVDSRRMHFLIEAKSLLSSPGKMIGEQYRIKWIAQAETIRH